MIWLFYIAVALLLLYGVLMQYYFAWWKNLPPFEASHEGFEPQTSITVVVPARNEAANIGTCLQSICAQRYPARLLQVIVVDDGSTDDTFKIATGFRQPFMEVISIGSASPAFARAPKKRAIEKAISESKGQLIVTTDADCVAGPDWLRTLAAYYEQKGHVFIAAPVKISHNKTLISKFQALDFMVMQGITGASVDNGFHRMCNGANLAYEKKVFLAVDGFSGIDKIASGDDMLLMNKIADAWPGAPGFVRSPAAIVVTQPAPDWKSFWQQRIRWASKARHYQHPVTFWILVLVYFVNLAVLSLLFAGIISKTALIYFFILTFAKFLLEMNFARSVANFFGQSGLILYLLLLQPLHMFYIVLAGLLGQVRTYEWKGRKLK